ncbi:MAG: sigma 54-interacting transcriptional regulator, partial [Deltaproteobacteria bacterium]|nr:sigma 54-interacting transcriptional regulator [Deltaproteobacteria bacterium]
MPNETTRKNEPGPRMIALASLFEGFFCVDWIMEITRMKVSEILAFIEAGVEKGQLTKIAPGRFRFKDQQERIRLQETLEPDEKKRSIQAIVHTLLKEPMEEDDTIKLVANHLLNTKNDVQGCRWLNKAALLYYEMYWFKKAKQCARKVLEDLAGSKSAEADELFEAAALGYSHIAIPDTAEIEPVFEALQAALKRARKRDHQPRIGLLEMHLGKMDYFLGNMNSAFRHLDRGWSIIKESNEPRLRRTATSYSTLLLYGQGRYTDVIANYEEFAPEVASHPESRVDALAAIYTGCAYGFTGNVTQGMGLLDALSTHYSDKGDHFIESVLSFGFGITLLELNRAAEALAYFKNSQKTAARAQSDIYQGFCHQYLAECYHRRNDTDKCIDQIKQCLESSQNMKMLPHHFFNLVELCWKIDQASLLDGADLSIDKMIHSALRGNYVYAKGLAYRCQGLLHKQAGEPGKKVIQAFSLSAKWLAASGHQPQLAKTYMELAGEYLFVGDKNKARKSFEKVASILDIYGDHLVPRKLMSLRKDHHDDKGLLEKIMALGQDLVTIRDNRELTGHILSAANQITGAERGAIFVLDRATSAPIPALRAAQNLTEIDVEAPVFGASMKMILETFSTQEGRILTRVMKKGPRAQKDGTVRDCICVPMKIRDNVVGVLYHDNRFFRSTFKQSDLKILSYFAAQAAIAMENAEAYELLQQENRYYEQQQLENFQFEEIVGESPAIQNVFEKVLQVADTDSNVLILGETGVGKELVARAIYQHSSRKDRPYIRVNCSAFPESLIAGELFGHEKGAFTGANERRIGRFELADKGILFLDEIGDISPNVQVRLLRVIQTKEFERLGGGKPIQSDFRLIAAPNRNLYDDVQPNRFPEDLYYRLHVF